MNEHSALDRVLHRLVLESNTVSELLFDLESGVFRNAAPRRDAVYVTGLARCGSTALLRALHSSGAFACLTYRDMPFVIAPNIWRRIAASSRVKAAGRERRHGDGIFEDLDSPEGLEEVFWRNELGDVYIRKDGLFVHDVSDATVERLKRYQSLICTRYGSSRYLAKNNNLVLRIRSLAPATPDCCYMVLFRDPLAHAASLLSQHQRFLMTSGFDRDYMRWLVHHEFGADHRPFRFFDAKSSTLPKSSLEYWLERWIDAYSYLLVVLTQSSGNVFPVHYERLCKDQTYRATIFDRVGVNSAGATFESRNRPIKGISGVLADRALAIYSELCSLANNQR